MRADELATLRKLEALNWILYDVNLFNGYVKSLGKRRPTSYKLMVGFPNICDESRYNKVIFLKNCNINASVREEDRLQLPEDVESLRIEECHDVKSLYEVSSLKNATELKACTILGCDGIEHVLSAPSTTPHLQSVESMTLVYLRNLHALVWKERGTSFLHSQTFSSLRKISITSCPTVKKLFTLALLVYLQNLQQLDISYCEQMAEIIAPQEDQVEDGDQIQGESSASNKLSLPKLRNLKLWSLLELEIFCNSKKAIIVDSLQEIYIYYCPKLKRFLSLMKRCVLLIL